MMELSTLVLIVLGAGEPVVIREPQRNIYACKRARNVERTIGVKRQHGIEVHAYCTPSKPVTPPTNFPPRVIL